MPVFEGRVLAAKAFKFSRALHGGRTRARTLDPLIKS